MKSLFAIVIILSSSFQLTYAMGNEYLHLVSGPVECPAGELKYDEINKKVIFDKIEYDFSVTKKEIPTGTIPTCKALERVIFKSSENFIQKETIVTSCIDPMDDFHLSEILTIDPLKRTALFQYVKTKTKSIKLKIKCRYKFRR
jgi:hypothetical protein